MRRRVGVGDIGKGYSIPRMGGKLGTFQSFQGAFDSISNL
jgi:hypothetical protein